MGGYFFVGFFTSLVFLGFTVGLSINANMDRNVKEVGEYKKADSIIDKTSKIEELNGINALLGQNSRRVESLSMLNDKPFSSLITNPDKVDTTLLNKYAEAAKIILTNNPNADDGAFSCANLENTKKITQDECLKIQDAQIDFYNINQGKLTYSLSSDMANRISIIQSNRQTNLSIDSSLNDSNTTTSNSKKIILSDKAFVKENIKVSKLEQKANDLIQDGKFTLASQTLSEIDKLNTNSIRTPQLRVELVLRQLIKSGNVLYEGSTPNDSNSSAKKTLQISNQDITKVDQDLKDSLIKSLATASETSALKYSSYGDSKILMENVANEMISSPEKYTNVTEEEKNRFISALSIIRSNN